MGPRSSATPERLILAIAAIYEVMRFGPSGSRHGRQCFGCAEADGPAGIQSLP